MSNVPPADKGRRRAIIERIMIWLEQFLLNQGYARFTISADKDFDVMRAKYKPIITLWLGEQQSEVEVYGRLYTDTSQGISVSYPFTLFVYMDRTTEEDKSHNYDLHILVDNLYKELRTKNLDPLEFENYGIRRIVDVSTRESDPQGMFSMVRMIMSGRLEVTRMDEA